MRENCFFYLLAWTQKKRGCHLLFLLLPLVRFRSRHKVRLSKLGVYTRKLFHDREGFCSFINILLFWSTSEEKWSSLSLYTRNNLRRHCSWINVREIRITLFERIVQKFCWQDVTHLLNRCIVMSQIQLRKILIVSSLFEQFLRTKCFYLNNYVADYSNQVRNTERSLSIYSPYLIVSKNPLFSFSRSGPISSCYAVVE